MAHTENGGHELTNAIGDKRGALTLSKRCRWEVHQPWKSYGVTKPLYGIDHGCTRKTLGGKENRWDRWKITDGGKTKIHCQVRTDRIGGSWASRGLPRPDRPDRQKGSCWGRTDRLGGSWASRDRTDLTHSLFFVVDCGDWGGNVSELSFSRQQHQQTLETTTAYKPEIL